MKRYVLIMVIALCCLLFPQRSSAQIAVAEVIRAGVKRVIKAIDLKVQRLQNETIWLQNAQKTIETALSKLKLEEISEWTDRQRVLYQDYFDELRNVKILIATLERANDVKKLQIKIVQEYSHSWNLLSNDHHYEPEELMVMQQVYAGILDESLSNLGQVTMVVNPFQTQMSDAERMAMINEAADRMETNYQDLLAFNRGNFSLSVKRSKDHDEVLLMKRYYGIE